MFCSKEIASRTKRIGAIDCTRAETGWVWALIAAALDVFRFDTAISATQPFPSFRPFACLSHSSAGVALFRFSLFVSFAVLLSVCVCRECRHCYSFHAFSNRRRCFLSIRSSPFQLCRHLSQMVIFFSFYWPTLSPSCNLQLFKHEKHLITADLVLEFIR